MAHEHLVKWGKEAFDKGFSLDHMENYLVKRGFKRKDALSALHEITAFEGKLHKELMGLKIAMTIIIIMLFLVITGIIIIYLPRL